MTLKMLNPKLTATLLILALSILLFFRHSQDFIPGRKVPGDFKVYQIAAARVATGVNPYIPTEGSPYKYSPAALLPLQLLPKQDSRAWMVFKALCIASLAASILVGACLSGWKEVLSLVLGFALAWKGLLETLDYGQMEFFVLFGGVLGARLLKSHSLAAGLVIGCLPWLKLPWGFLTLPFLMESAQRGRRSWSRFSAGWILGFLGFGMALPLVFFGMEKTIFLTQSWFDLLAHQPQELFLSDLNQSVWSTATRWLRMNSAWGMPAVVLLALACLLIFFQLVRSSFRQSLVEAPLARLTPWLILMQLVNPLSWRWGSLLLIGASWVIPGHFRLRSVFSWWMASLLIVLFLIQLNPIASFLGFDNWTVPHRFGSITFYWLVVLLLSASTQGLSPLGVLRQQQKSAGMRYNLD
ncbi:MAG: glycosyltransferase 87 family protein [Bdellovibrionia bacterium]